MPILHPDSKLPFFPSPGTDELLYSIIARYHNNCSNVSLKATVTDLFGSPTACAVLDLPNRLEILHGHLSPNTLLTLERLINDHTLLPFYRPFLPRHRLRTIVNWMKGSGRGGSIHMSAGIMASTVHSPHFLRCCPECLKVDEQSIAEQPYWHRCHQVAGVWVCHIHGSWLLETPVAAAAANKHAFYLPPAKVQLHLCGKLGDERFLEHSCRIAASVAWLLKASADLVPGLRSLQKRYLHLLRQNDLVTYNGRVRQRELLDRFLSHYGAGYLELLDCGIDPDSQDNWLSALVRKPRKVTHPLRHLLLINFLGLTPEQFLSGSTSKYRPFGRGPWPCLNPAAPHYRQSVVTEYICDHCNENGEPVGIFTCECGFSYGRTWKEGEHNDRMRLGWHVSFGALWEAELLRLVRQEAASLREAARRLEVDVNTVNFQLQRIEQRHDQTIEMVPTTYSLEKEQSKRRNNWLAILKSHPELGRKALRMQAKADFAWLYRNDRVWLCENQPEPLPRPVPIDRVDWRKRDLEIAAKIEPAVMSMQNSTAVPKRITVTAIGIRLGLRSLLEKKLHKLPRTAHKLREMADSDESFIERRIEFSVRQMEAEGIPTKPWRVLRRAAIRDSALVQEVISRKLGRVF